MPALAGRPGQGSHVQLDGDWENAVTLEMAGSDWVSTLPVSTEPLSDKLLARIAEATVLEVIGPMLGEPGDPATLRMTTHGFAEAVAALECPPPPPEPAETAVTDLTGMGLVWGPSDIGFNRARAADGSIVSWPAATLETSADVPALGLTCEGLPFFFAGDWGAPGGATLRITVDGDPDMVRDESFTGPRTTVHSTGGLDDLTPRIREGRTLRAMLILHPARDVRYPLDGAAEALRLSGC